MTIKDAIIHRIFDCHDYEEIESVRIYDHGRTSGLPYKITFIYKCKVCSKLRKLVVK